MKLVIDTVYTFSAHLILLCDFELQFTAHPTDFKLNLSLSQHALRIGFYFLGSLDLVIEWLDLSFNLFDSYNSGKNCQTNPFREVSLPFGLLAQIPHEVFLYNFIQFLLPPYLIFC